MKTAILRQFDRVGLLLPLFRSIERWHSVGKRNVATATDELPLPPIKLMVRVMGLADQAVFLQSGRLAEQAIRGALDRAGSPLGSMDAILDFGCGCGRVLRRWRTLGGRVCGSDLSAPAVAWCSANLPFAEVAVNALEPPLRYSDASFDLVYAFSVFTHLPVATQLAWRNEFARILRPGGYLLFTLHGDAYLPRLKPDETETYARGQCVVRWAEVAGSNLCAAYHPESFVRDQLARGWECVDFVPRGALGSPEQDLVLLRKPW